MSDTGAEEVIKKGWRDLQTCAFLSTCRVHCRALRELKRWPSVCRPGPNSSLPLPGSFRDSITWCGGTWSVCLRVSANSANSLLPRTDPTAANHNLAFFRTSPLRRTCGAIMCYGRV
ncbi:hypothetical protein L596_004954 [Steinernema carpocapsae]|uniref:Uncharacterized protein n=1 Tax=Steinernema carpocapsae TaxID=34508 RepID=A0A4U8V114_STECR|nr:hypothetical protein L596_004954 [Steinernema carpocapsae]